MVVRVIFITQGFDTNKPSSWSREPYDPTRVLIHDDQYPVGTQRCRLAPEQIHTRGAVFHVAEEREPGWASRSDYGR